LVIVVLFVLLQLVWRNNLNS